MGRGRISKKKYTMPKSQRSDGVAAGATEELDAGELQLSLPTLSFMLPQTRTSGRAALSFVPFRYLSLSFGLFFFLSGFVSARLTLEQAWAQGKGELATCRHRAVRVMIKKKKICTALA